MPGTPPADVRLCEDQVRHRRAGSQRRGYTGCILRPRQNNAWDAAAVSYDAERRADAVYLRCLAAAREAIERVRPRRLLDVGCGTGLATLQLCGPGRTVLAADFSYGSLRVLQNKAGAPPLTQADVTALPFAAASFDAVLCANTLQHLVPSYQRAAVTELRRILKPSGTLVVTVHHYSRAKQLAGWIKEGRPGQAGIDYIFRFTAAELQALLPGADVYSIGLDTRLDVWLPRSVRRLMARRGHGHMLLASATMGAAGPRR